MFCPWSFWPVFKEKHCENSVIRIGTHIACTGLPWVQHCKYQGWETPFSDASKVHSQSTTATAVGADIYWVLNRAEHFIPVVWFDSLYNPTRLPLSLSNRRSGWFEEAKQCIQVLVLAALLWSIFLWVCYTCTPLPWCLTWHWPQSRFLGVLCVHSPD